MRLAENATRMAEMRNFSRYTRTIPLGTHKKSLFGDNIKKDLIEIGYVGADGIHLALDRD
jgi:hypothetical protein